MVTFRVKSEPIQLQDNSCETPLTARSVKAHQNIVAVYASDIPTPKILRKHYESPPKIKTPVI